LVLGPAVIVGGSLVFADGPALTLHARAAAASATTQPMTIELFHWSTDAERAPLVAALAAPTPPPAAPAAAAAPGRAGGRGAGRGARGGRAAAPPLSPAARLDAAIKAAPTCGYIWGEGVTGYSIKYAWRSPASEGGDRIVLVAARRIGGSSLPPATTAPPEEGDFTVIEMRLDGKGIGEAKASYANVVVDPATKTLALDSQASSPLLLKVTR
jgi:hypothetical protein